MVNHFVSVFIQNRKTMRGSAISFAILALMVIATQCQTTGSPTTTKKPRRKRRTPLPTNPPLSPDETVKVLQRDVKTLKNQLSQISRQLMLQQFFTEEKIRNEGFSGIKQVRTEKGT